MKKKIVLVVLSIIFGIIIGILSFKIVNKVSNDSFDNRLEILIDNHNRINKIFDKIDKKDSFYFENTAKCYLYNGDDTYKYLELISSTYYYVFDNNPISIFQKDKEKLYICIPDYCKSLNLDMKNVTIESNDSERKIMKIENSEYVLIKDDGIWKFASPILDCDIQKMMEKNTK